MSKTKKANAKKVRRNRCNREPDVSYIAISFKGRQEEKYYKYEDDKHFIIKFPSKNMKDVDKMVLALDTAIGNMSKPKDWYCVQLYDETGYFNGLKMLNYAWMLSQYSEELGIPLIVMPGCGYDGWWENQQVIPNKIAKKFFPDWLTAEEHIKGFRDFAESMEGDKE